MTRQAFRFRDMLDGIKTVVTRPGGDVVPLPLAENMSPGQRFDHLLRSVASIEAAIADTTSERDDIRRSGAEAIETIEAEIKRQLDANDEDAAQLKARLFQLRSALADLIAPAGLEVEVPR